MLSLLTTHLNPEKWSKPIGDIGTLFAQLATFSSHQIITIKPTLDKCFRCHGSYWSVQNNIYEKAIVLLTMGFVLSFCNTPAETTESSTDSSAMMQSSPMSQDTTMRTDTSMRRDTVPRP